MSSRVQRDNSKVAIQRFNKATSTWVTINAASVLGTEDYQLQDNSTTKPISYIPTPIIGAQNATLTFTRYGLRTQSAETILGAEMPFVGDTVRIRYNGQPVGSGDGRYTVESVDVTETRDTFWAPKMGLDKRIDVTCQMGGLYADLLSRTVSWGPGTSLPGGLPNEPWLTRIQRWVKVSGWPDGV